AADGLLKKVTGALDGSGDSAAPEPTPALANVYNDLLELYKNVEKADATPNVAQVDAMGKLGTQVAGALKSWEEIRNREIPLVNQQLSANGLPELRLDLPPREEEHGDNEE